MGASTWLWLAGVYLLWVALACLVSAGLIGWDKRQARRGRWRVPEATLHLWEVLGGWPGSWIARRHFRHKTAKRSYVWTARAAAAVHVVTVAAIVALLYGGALRG